MSDTANTPDASRDPAGRAQASGQGASAPHAGQAASGQADAAHTAQPQPGQAAANQGYAQGYGYASTQGPAGQQPFQAPPAQDFGQAACARPQQPYAYGYAYAPQPAAPAKPKGGKGGWIALGIILFAIVFVFTVGALSCSHAVSGITSGAGLLADAGDEVVTSGDSVGVIDMGGTIQYDGSACSPEGLRALLKEAEDNPDIKAVVLRVDSGGGTATAGEEMAAYVREFSKPIVVSSASMNCSAAYEISSQADYIFVNETTAIGAIGTIMQVQDISGLLDMLGISVDNIASADSKDSSYGTRPLTDDERAYYQQLVDEINETFIQNVAAGRGMDVEAVRGLATGMQFSGVAAVENGLADEVGIYDDALDKAAELGGITARDGGVDEGGYDVVTLTAATNDLSYLIDLLGSESEAQEQEGATSISAEDLIAPLKEEGVLS